jgi:hypothetical protein
VAALSGVPHRLAVVLSGQILPLARRHRAPAVHCAAGHFSNTPFPGTFVGGLVKTKGLFVMTAQAQAVPGGHCEAFIIRHRQLIRTHPAHGRKAVAAVSEAFRIVDRQVAVLTQLGERKAAFAPIATFLVLINHRFESGI